MREDATQEGGDADVNTQKDNEGSEDTWGTQLTLT